MAMYQIMNDGDGSRRTDDRADGLGVVPSEKHSFGLKDIRFGDSGRPSMSGVGHHLYDRPINPKDLMPTPLDAIAGVANACQATPTLVTGGQPELRHLEALKAAGASLVLDIRDPMEPRPIDEPQAVRKLGMEYVNIPVRHGALNDEPLTRILDTLRDAGGKTVFLHCASGNRVGGALLPYFMLDQQAEEEAAIDQAMRVGLRSVDLLEWGLSYARRKLGTT